MPPWPRWRLDGLRSNRSDVSSRAGANTMPRQLEQVGTAGDLNYQLIVDTIPALVATMTPDGQVEHVNRQVYEYFGRTLDELKKWGTVDAVHPDDLQKVIDA